MKKALSQTKKVHVPPVKMRNDFELLNNIDERVEDEIRGGGVHQKDRDEHSSVNKLERRFQNRHMYLS